MARIDQHIDSAQGRTPLQVGENQFGPAVDNILRRFSKSVAGHIDKRQGWDTVFKPLITAILHKEVQLLGTPRRV